MIKASCDISIQLDEPGPFKPGDRIRGKVEVGVSKACKCKALTIELEWYAHGRGNTRSRSIDEKVLCSDEQFEEGYHSYRFEFEAPNGPFSYHGEYLNVDWGLEARADVPWAVDPKAQRDFLMHPGPSSKPLKYDVGERRLRIAAEGKHFSKLERYLAMGGAFALIVGLGMIIVGGVLIVLGFIAFIAGAVMVGVIARRMLAMTRLKDLKVEVSPLRVAPGEEVDLKMQFSPTSSMQINEIRATLSATERVVYGHGSSSSTYTQVVYEAPFVLLGSRALSSGERVNLSEKIRLPEDAPLSLSATDNDLYWGVKVHADIARWPDWVKDYPIAVVPPGC